MRTLLLAMAAAAALAGTTASLAADAPAAASAATPASAASAPPGHRPLRSHWPAGLPEPTEPQAFNGWAGAPPHTVVPRKDQLQLYPCSQCHKLLPLNTTPRKLVAAPHPAALNHGKGTMWCLDCHQGTNRDVLRTIGGMPVDFDQSDRLCAQCHSARHRDWSFGAHGKRAGGQWLGAQRTLYACTHCHDPHRPQLALRQPSKPPPVRAGLAPMQPVTDHLPLLWRYMRPGDAVSGRGSAAAAAAPAQAAASATLGAKP